MKPLLSIPTSATVDLLIYKDAVDRDIGFYIDKTLDPSDFESWPPSIKAEARRTLIQKADGM
jgi:ankyrin repeat domain-containing protein 50